MTSGLFQPLPMIQEGSRILVWLRVQRDLCTTLEGGPASGLFGQEGYILSQKQEGSLPCSLGLLDRMLRARTLGQKENQ